MNIVITGANRGLGYELTKKFVGNNHTVIACYYSKESYFELDLLTAKHKGKLVSIPMDVTDEASVAKAAQRLSNESLLIDAIISNAGVLCHNDRTNGLLDMLVEDLRLSLDVNLVGPALVIKYFYPMIRKSADSIFITITSEAGSIINSGSNFPAYSISKAAANKLVSVFRCTVSDVRILALHPGRMNTDMGKENAQVEASESAEGIYNIVIGGHKNIDRGIWFVDYKALQMVL